MFTPDDWADLERLQKMGARRVRFTNGAEVEFDNFRMLPVGAMPEDPTTGDTAPLEAMPSRSELRKLAEGLAPPEVPNE